MQLVARLSLLLIGGLIGLSIAEVAVRVGLVHDPVGEYLRVDGEAADSQATILLLGDSFVDKRGDAGQSGFHRRFVDALAGERVAIVNLAVSGTGPVQYLEALRRHGEDIGPDIVVVFYFAGNDLINVMRHAPLQPHTGIGRIRDWLRPWIHRSRFYHAVTERQQAPEFDFDAMARDGHDADLVARARVGEVNPWLLLIPRDVRSSYLRTNLLIESEESRSGVDKLRDTLHDIAAESDTIGASLQFVVFPATTQINRSHFDFYERAGFDPDERTLLEVAPQRMISAIAAELDVPVLDLLPVFRAQGDVELYRPYDSHLNDRGNALAAERAGRFVAEALHEGSRGSAPVHHPPRLP